jgi:hypothetical protein
VYSAVNCISAAVEWTYAALDLGEEAEGHAAPDAVVRHDEVDDPVRRDVVDQPVLPHICCQLP